SSLIISDWTGKTDNGWELNFHTGISKTTENYEKEVDNILSTEFCLAFAQSFEALETFLKDIFHQSSLQEKPPIERDKIPGGENLFKLIKTICGEDFKKSSNRNNKNLRFKQFWSTISESRHAIIHSSRRIKMNRVNKSSDHFAVFNYLFDYDKLEDEILLIKLNYNQLNKVLKHVSEFAYQVYKILSEKEKLEYKLEKDNAHKML
ncbi:MAG: hypothetical protein ACM31G_01495, partial [Flavobacteriales bacterium]